MEKLEIIVKPRFEFSLKKCGDVIPYGITPEERAKLAEYPEFDYMATKEYVDNILGDVSTALETILAIEV